MSNTIDARLLFSCKDVSRPLRKQNTISESVSLTGFGFWTGNDVTIQFRPAPPNSGIVFVRSDISGQPRIPALVQYRAQKPRQTSLKCGDAQVDMVEHVLAALSGLQIDNCEIWTDQPEMPGFDGSSQIFVAALNGAGKIAQSARRPIRIVTRAFHIGDQHTHIVVTTNRLGTCSFQYTLAPEKNYPIQIQRCIYEHSPESFSNELASCRTFAAKYEADALLAQGLCQRVTPENVLVLTETGPLENSFRFENECARHKTLDMVGDFALLGCDLVGTLESFRGGHIMNAECVKQLLEKTMLISADDVIQSNPVQASKTSDFFRDAA